MRLVFFICAILPGAFFMEEALFLLREKRKPPKGPSLPGADGKSARPEP